MKLAGIFLVRALFKYFSAIRGRGHIHFTRSLTAITLLFAISVPSVLVPQQAWAANHTVTFNGNTNTGGATAAQKHNSNAGPVALTLNGFTKTNYTFNGWNTAANGSGSAYADGASYPFTADVTLYAQWLANNHTVIFNANGGTGSMANQVTNTATALTTNTFTRSNYSFTGWNTAANGSGSAYADGASYPFTADVTLFAQWSAIPSSFTVIFDGNGSTGGSTPNQVASSLTALTNNGFTRTGYAFVDWNTQATGGGITYVNGANYDFNANITLYARWQVNALLSSTLTFNSNGGSGAISSQVSAVTAAISTNAFTRSGFTFVGWNTQANGGGINYSDGANYDFAADLILYASWQADSVVTHTITFNANGGGGTMPNQVSAVSAAISANSFTRSGFNFVGWISTPTGGTHYNAGSIYPFTTGITLYAEWSAIIVPPVTGGGGGSAPVITTPVIRTVTFNGNGVASGSMATQSSDKAAPLTKLAFARPGYNFDHWSTKPDVDGTLFHDEEIFPFYADTTLYAHWSIRETKQVSFSSNGPVTTSMTFQAAINPTPLLNKTIVRTGYTFTGWNTSSDGTGAKFPNGAVYSFDSDLVLYAQWALVPFQSSSISVTNPLVLPLGANESLNLHLSIQNPDGTSTAATVQVPQGLVGVDSTIRITPISTTESVLLGLVSLQVEVLDDFGSPIPQMLEPLTMQLSNNYGEYIVAESSDGFIWSLLPELSGTMLGEGQKAGFYYDADGLIVVVTSHLTQFGLRKRQASQFQITTPSSAIFVAGSAALARSGGSGSGVVRYGTSTPTVCVVSEAGVVKATAVGTCRLTATKGGDAIFLNSNPSTVSILVGQSKNALSISGTGATKNLTINLGASFAKTIATIQIKLPNANTYQKVVTKLLGAKGEAMVPLTAAQGSTVQVLVSNKVVATLKVSG